MSAPVAKRQTAVDAGANAGATTSLDLGGLLGTVLNTTGGLLSVVTGLLSTVTSTVGDLETTIQSILDGTVADVTGALDSVTGQLQDLIDLASGVLNQVDLNDLTNLDLAGELDSLIPLVESLVADVDALTSSLGVNADLTQVTDLVQQLLGLLQPLTGTIGVDASGSVNASA